MSPQEPSERLAEDRRADTPVERPAATGVGPPADIPATAPPGPARDEQAAEAPVPAPTLRRHRAPTSAAPTSAAPTQATHHVRKPEGPRRVRGGVKLRARDGAIPSTRMSDAILRRLEAAIPADEMIEGLRYARLGQIISLTNAPGSVRAAVQGTQVRPHTTKLAIGAYAPARWDRIIDAMATEAVYLVKLLASELPDGIDVLLHGLGLRLLPGVNVTTESPDAAADEVPDELLIMECSCPRGGRCRHAAAVGYVLAEQLAANPLLVFTLRGMPAEALLERLRQARMLQARGVASAHVDPMIPESKTEPAPLEMCVDEFWRPGRRLEELQDVPPPKHVAHALLRRLGPSPLVGRFPLVGLLASIYDAVSEHAVKLRDRAEDIDGGE